MTRTRGAALPGPTYKRPPPALPVRLALLYVFDLWAGRGTGSSLKLGAHVMESLGAMK